MAASGELQGLEILYDSPGLQLQGLEFLYDQVSAQLRGLEIEVDWQPYLETGPYYVITSDCIGGPGVDAVAFDTAVGIDIGIVGQDTSDTASGIEVFVQSGVVASESASGIELATFTGSGDIDVVATDTASGIDTFTLTASETLSLSGAETASGIDQVFGPALVTESASGTDFAQLFLFATDTASGTEALSLSGSETLSVSGADLAIGTETFAISGLIFATDTASGLEATSTGPLPQTETASGTETGLIGILATEAASGIDTAVLSSVQFFAAESASGMDTAAAEIFLTATESATGSEVSALIGLSVTEMASGVDSFSFPLDWLASDTAQATDIACVFVDGPLEPPVLRIGPDTRLPRWHSGHVDPGSLLFRILQRGVAEQVVPFKEELRRGFLRRWLAVAEVGENRLEWTVPFSTPANRELTFTFSAETAMGPVSGTIRQAISAFDFTAAVEPVWWVDPLNRQIRFRNLAMKVAQRYSTSDVYTICGEFDGILPDVGVFYRRHPDNYWEWLNPEGPAMTGDFFVLPGTGFFQIAYGSRTLLRALATGTIRANYPGGQSIALPATLLTPDNVFDGYGHILGMPRFVNEDNLAYKRRMLNETIAPADPTLRGVIRGVASRLGRLTHQIWNGVSPLILDTTGASAITSITIVGVDRLREITEELTPSFDKQHFTATYGGWRPGSLVLVDGMPEQGTSLSGNVITLSRSVSGTVSAVYSIEQYSLVEIVSGFISRIDPGTGLASGSYEILYARGVNAHTVDLPDYFEQQLLGPEGLANGLLLDIARELTHDNPTTFGRARWGKGATWLDEEGDHPKTARLPVPLDFNRDE